MSAGSRSITHTEKHVIYTLGCGFCRSMQAFYEGFIDAMHRYRTEIDLKVGIDRTQMTYQCCGALSYEDWFEVSWVDVAFVDKFDGDVGK